MIKDIMWWAAGVAQLALVVWLAFWVMRKALNNHTDTQTLTNVQKHTIIHT